MLTLVLALAAATLSPLPPTRAAADSAYFAGRPAAAVSIYRELLKEDPADSALLWRATRAALAAGWIIGEEKTSIGWYHEAQAFGRRALAASPTSDDAAFWLGASLGREAQVSGDAHTRVRLAEEARTLALAVLARNPDHAGAHNLLGQIHYQVVTTPWALRTIGARIIGARIPFKASWQEAEMHLALAVELDATMIAYRLELGRLYLRTGRPALARPQLQRALELPRVHPPDRMFQEEAAVLLRQT